MEDEPTVERLEVHLEGNHIVYYKEGEHENEETVGKETSMKLLAYFELFSFIETLDIYSMSIFQSIFCWDKAARAWKPRAMYKIRNSSLQQYEFSIPQERVVEKMYSISPRKGEGYFLRTLLLQKSGVTSFETLKFHEGVQHP